MRPKVHTGNQASSVPLLMDHLVQITGMALGNLNYLNTSGKSRNTHIIMKTYFIISVESFCFVLFSQKPNLVSEKKKISIFFNVNKKRLIHNQEIIL